MEGTAVQSSLRFVRKRFGEAPLARVIDALPGSDRAAFSHGVLASSWYGMDAFLRFMQEAERQLWAEEPDVVRRMGRERIYGWMQHTLELAGARDLGSAHSACVHRGDAVCRFEGTWD